MTGEPLIETLEAAEIRLLDLNRRRLEALHARYLGAGGGDLSVFEAEEARILAGPEYVAALEGGAAAPPDRTRRLDLHRRRRLEGLVRTDLEVARRMRDLHEQVLAFQPWLADGPAQWADVREAIRREPDRDRREAAWFASTPLAERLEADLARLMARRNELARALGFDTFPRLAMESAGLPMLDFLSLCDELEPLTRPVFEQMLTWAREKSGQEVLEPWDIDYLLGAIEPAAADFPRDGFAGQARGLAAAWGIDLAALPVDVRSVNLPYGGLMLPVRIPDDIRLLVNPRDGWPHLEVYLHEHGHALHATHMRPANGAFQWEAGAFDEAMALLTESAGLQRVMAARPAKPAEAAWRMWRSVYRLRQLMASAVFEILAYEKPESDLHGLYCEIQENYLGFPRHPERLWSARTLFITHPAWMPNYVAGRLIADQLSAYFFDRFGAVDRPEVGEILRAELWGPGAARPWEERLAAVTGQPLDPNGFLKETGIPDSV